MVAKKETLSFDAEVGKILSLMINSIYENKDIFLRELISNASDALDRLRYAAITKPELLQKDHELKIKISTDKEKHTINIEDNGTGMSRADLIANLGTIARSGTQNFIEKLTGDAKKDTRLIGQFGVGFYSSFMVADRVSVISQAAGGKKAHLWESEGTGKFVIEEAEENIGRGTRITLHLKDGEEEFLDKFRLKHIVKIYSDHVDFPIEFIEKNDGGEESSEILNSASALWLKPKSEISDEQYKEFYHHVGHAADDPWLVLHNKAEGAIEYTNLLFIPSVRPFDLFHPDRARRVKLYVRRVFITDEGAEIVPSYLRFLRGVVDSEDLPLNISRETLQNNAVVRKIRTSITNKVLGELKKKAEKDKQGFKLFWENFGAALKEGLCDASENRDKLLEVCHFYSTNKIEELTGLDAYLERMKDDQKYIYYISGESLESLKQSPQIEGLVNKGIEVLLLTDGVDDFWVNVNHEYKGKQFRSVTRAGVDLEEKAEGKKSADGGKKDDKKSAKSEKLEGLITFFKETLDKEIQDVRVSSKLTNSPVCLVAPEGGMDIRMERFLVESKQLQQKSAKILEINPDHKIIKTMLKDIADSKKTERLKDAVHLLFVEASIVEGETISNVVDFSRRLNGLLEKSLVA